MADIRRKEQNNSIVAENVTDDLGLLAVRSNSKTSDSRRTEDPEYPSIYGTRH